MEEVEFTVKKREGKRIRGEGAREGWGVAGLVLGHAALRRSVLNTQTVS